MLVKPTGHLLACMYVCIFKQHKIGLGKEVCVLSSQYQNIRSHYHFPSSLMLSMPCECCISMIQLFFLQLVFISVRKRKCGVDYRSFLQHLQQYMDQFWKLTLLRKSVRSHKERLLIVPAGVLMLETSMGKCINLSSNWIRGTTGTEAICRWFSTEVCKWRCEDHNYQTTCFALH